MTHTGEGRGADAWGIVLAGGDGVRLRPLIRSLTGEERPKQFCRVLGGATLLDQTRHRLGRLVPAARTCFVLNRAHERFYGPALAAVPPWGLVVQPTNRGTAPAIAYALHRVAAVAPAAPVVIMPSDHHVSDDGVFMDHVGGAVAAVQARPELVVLLGIAPDRPEVEYGWIEPGEPVGRPEAGRGDLFRVRRFWEKPPRPLAARLDAAGCLWNSFVLVARVPALLGLIREALPPLAAAFAGLEPGLGAEREADATRVLYARLPSSDFSRDVLAPGAGCLGVLRVDGVDWSDLGDPARVLGARARMADDVAGAAVAR